MKRLLILLLAASLLPILSMSEEAPAMINRIDIEVNGQVRTATLCDNISAMALLERLAHGPLTVEMHDYGSFEKVGPIDEPLPECNEQITTTPGDIILFMGNNITIYYDVNAWNFTLLGHIDGATGENMREFLGDGDPTVVFSLHVEE